MALNRSIKHLSITDSTITPEIEKKAKDELFEDAETKSSTLDIMKSKISENDFPPFFKNEIFLLQLLRARKYDITRSFDLCKSHLSFLHDLFDAQYVDSKGGVCKVVDMVESVIDSQLVHGLSQRDDDGCAVLIVDSSKWDCNKFSVHDCFAAIAIVTLVANQYSNSQISGLKLIIDFRQLFLRHLMKMFDPRTIWIVRDFAKDFMPGRMKAIHYIAGGSASYTACAVVKKILSNKLKKRVILHNASPDKIKEYISPSILPVELGGTSTTCNRVYWIELLNTSRPYITEYIESVLKIT